MAIYAEATEGRAQLAPGTYEVTCIDVKEDELDNARDPLVWRFYFETEATLDPATGNPMQIDGIASRYLTPNSKAWAWCDALGMVLEIGKRHNLEDVIGGKALAKVIVKPGTGGKSGFSRIETIMPLPKSGVVSRRAEPAEDDLSAWWKNLRDNGFARDDVYAKSQAMFDNREPKDLTAPERAKVTEALIG